MIDETADEAAERMERRWTPGPWAVSGIRYKMSGSEWQNVFRYREDARKDEAICAVSVDPKTLLGLSDARLIAAAPELYEALARLLTWVKPLVSGTDREEIDSIEQACVALRKARGE